MPLKTNSLVNVRNMRRFALPTSFAAIAVLGTSLSLHQAGAQASTSTKSPLDDKGVVALTQLDHAMETLAARVTPSVVNVAVTGYGSQEEREEMRGQQLDPQELPPGLRQFFGFGNDNGRGGRRGQPEQQSLQHAIGSGVIISPDGYIVTNHHVVDGATQIKVTLHDRRVLIGKVVGSDKLTDLAVIKVDAHDLPAISWGDSSKLQPGQTVLAFGSPFGYLQFSVTRGIVSAINRAAPSTDGRRPGGLIQTDAAVNPGNSGGPLVDSRGELVGINFLIASNSGQFAGASFAIPAEIAQSVTKQIIKTGAVHHGYLGVNMNDVTPDNAQFFNLKSASGTIVAQVTPGSPASAAGLKQGDVIQRLNGNVIENGTALQMAVSNMEPGARVQLGILRNGASQTVSVKLGEYDRKAEVAADEGNREETGLSSGKLGLAMADLTPDVRQHFKVPTTVTGAAIQDVRSDSPAEDAGLQPGDIIVEVNRHAVTSASQVANDVKQAGGGKDVLLLVWSQGSESYRLVRPSAG